MSRENVEALQRAREAWDADNLDASLDELELRGIGTLIHYPMPIHGHPLYRALGDGQVPLTQSERLAEQIASLRLYPELTDHEVEFVAGSVRDAAERP